MRIRVIWIIGLAVAGGVIFYLYRRHQSQQDQQDQADTQEGDQTITSSDYAPPAPPADLTEQSDPGAPVESGILSPVGPSPGSTVFMPPVASSQAGGGPPTTHVNIHYPTPKKPQMVAPKHGKCPKGYRAVHGKRHGKRVVIACELLERH